MSIYGDLNELETLLDNAYNLETGEISEEDMEAYEQLKKELAEGGLEKLAKLRVNQNSILEGVKSEIERLTIKKKRLEGKIKWIEQYAMVIFDRSDKNKDNKIIAGTFTIGTRKSESVVVECEVKDLPNEYVNTKIDLSPDKKALKEAIKDGKEIKGVRIETNLNISIK